MYTLYYSPNACSLAVHALLIDIGAKYELVNVKEAQNHDAFVKANPRAMVPTLIVEGKPLYEGAAILTYLADTHRSTLLPVAGWERAKALEWLSFANSTLHPKYGALFASLFKIGMSPADADKNPLTSAALDGIQQCWDQVEQELQSKQYMVGSEATIGDILLTVIANWSPAMPRTIKFGPKTKAYLTRVSALPSYQKAMAEEKVEYKVAA